MKVHELKTWPEPFLALWDGDKTYEVRKNDRDFGVGDELVLHEYRPDNRVGGPGGGYTPRTIRATVTYMTRGGDWGLPHNLCVMALRVLIRIGERPPVTPKDQEKPTECPRCAHPWSAHVAGHGCTARVSIGDGVIGPECECSHGPVQ